MTLTNPARVRPAKLGDTFIPYTGRFLVLENDDGPIAWGGVAYMAKYMAVCGIIREGYRLSLAKACKSYKTMLYEYDAVYANAQEEFDTASNFLKWLGFVPIGISNNKVVYKLCTSG